MSLVADKPRAVSSRRRTNRPVKRRVVTTNATPKARTRTVTRSRVKARTQSNSNWLAVPFAFVVVASMAFVASSVAGNVLLEQARRDRINSVERVNSARLEVARLRIELNGLTSMAAVDRWAQANRMHLSGVEVPEYLTNPAQTAVVASLEQFQELVASLPDDAGIQESSDQVVREPEEIAPTLIVASEQNAENLPE